jgi:nickel/cobalt transporter (NicO) family protein
MTRLVALAAFVALALSAAEADAHPLDNFTVNHLTEVAVADTGVQLRYILDIAEIPTSRPATRRVRGSCSEPTRRSPAGSSWPSTGAVSPCAASAPRCCRSRAGKVA